MYKLLKLFAFVVFMIALSVIAVFFIASLFHGRIWQQPEENTQIAAGFFGFVISIIALVVGGNDIYEED